MSEQPSVVPTVEHQTRFWNDWNAETRERARGEVSERQAEVILGWVSSLGRSDLRILDVGCGSGWFSAELARFGTVVAVDLSDEVLLRAQKRYPMVTFVAGDFAGTDLGGRGFDIVVSLEVLAHVSDQAAFVERISGLLVRGGELMLATQNSEVLQHHCRIPAPGPGQLRRWVSLAELRHLVNPHFEIVQMGTVTPIAHTLPRRLLTSSRLRRALGPVGLGLRSVLERAGWGWTILLRARVRTESLEG